ncbi:DUF1232 domain-containing protein [Fusobacterium russii]|nr:DUF1232 domain-containing protein [Fusobacterium russii]
MKYVKLLLALGYIILPVDFIPEALLGYFGLIDDGAALIYIATLLFGND